MKAKGTAIKATKDFIQKRFPLDYERWLNALPQKSREILSQPILSSNWYPLYEAFIIPTEIAGNMFFSTPEEAAYEIGRFSAINALKGIYKIFLKISTIQYVIKRTPSIYKTYYDKGEMLILESGKDFANVLLRDVDVRYEIFFNRIMGWMAAIPTLTGNRLKSVDFEKKIKEDQLEAIFYFRWE